MKKQTLILFIFIIVSIIALANPPQKTNPPQKSVVRKTTVARVAPTQKVAADAVKYNKSNVTEEMIVDGKDVIVSGNDNKLTINGKIIKIFITGKNNDLTVVAVNEIEVTGSGNFVSWEKTNNGSPKPVILDKGGYNNIEKRSGNAQAKEEN